jgi:hypothetical protein
MLTSMFFIHTGDNITVVIQPDDDINAVIQPIFASPDYNVNIVIQTDDNGNVITQPDDHC